VNLPCSVFETEAFWVVGGEKMDTADKWDNNLLSNVGVVVVAVADCWP